MINPQASDLARVPLFEGVSNDQLEDLARHFEVNEYQAGAKPAREGEHGYAFFVLAEGSAHAEHNGHLLEQFVPGSVFGEMAFFEKDSHRTATVVADTPIRVFSMFGTDFRNVQLHLPEVAARLEQLFTERHARSEAVDHEG